MYYSFVPTFGRQKSAHSANFCAIYSPRTFRIRTLKKGKNKNKLLSFWRDSAAAGSVPVEILCEAIVYEADGKTVHKLY